MSETQSAKDVLWDIGDLFADAEDPKLHAEMQEAKQLASSFTKTYRGKVESLTAAGLNEAVAAYEKIQSLLGRAYVFAELSYSTDTSDQARGAFVQKVQELDAAIETQTLFFKLEWIALDDAKARSSLASQEMSAYRHWLELLRRDKPHVLSEPEEKVLKETSMSGSAAWKRLFTDLAGAFTVDFDGESLTFEAALSKLYSPEREVRRTAARAITTELERGLRTRTFVLNTILLDKATTDRLRNYPTWISDRNLSNEASDESVQALIDAVVSRYDIAQRYYRLKARLLGLDKIADYDRFAPVSVDSTTVTWDEGKRIVLEAYHDFSPEAGKIIGRFFDDNWIDAAAYPNKSPGAYCMTVVPYHHPYVLMNYTDDRNSVFTLAHELGHGLHGVLGGSQSLLNANTPLTLAETASVFGEALTFSRYLRDVTEPKQRLSLLTGRLEDAIGTSFRQIALNRFEESVHLARRDEGELAVERINELWRKAQTHLFQDSVEVTDDYNIWWSYIAHFFEWPGYVYAYSFGYLFSLAIYQKYLEDKDAMVAPYMELLAAGGSDSPERLAKIVGIDVSDPGFWTRGLDAIDSWLKEAEVLAEKI
ncbi:MAG: M3 family oligoendopeptidase [Actinomycetota bacterium]